MIDLIFPPMPTLRRAGGCLVLFLAAALTASAQTFPFTMSFQQGGTTTTIPNGAGLTLVAASGQVQAVQVRAIYVGGGSASITQAPAIVGTSTLTATVDQTLPLSLSSGQSFTFTIRYAPTSSTTSTGQLTLPYIESPDQGAPPITLNLQGLSSALALSYVLPADQNFVPINDNDTIPFPDTVVGGSSSATINVTNLGSGPGQVTAIDIAGAAFRLQNKPLLPSTVAAGQNLQFQVIYRPTAQADDTGTVTITLAGAAPVAVRLAGRGIVPVLSYHALNPESPLTPGDTITLPSVEPNQTTTRNVRISNSGTAPATISQILVSGQGFVLNSVVTLPLTLAPGGSTILAVGFTPTQGGTRTGTLVVNSDSFTLGAAALAPVLTYSYTVAGNVVNVGPGSAIIFSPTQVSTSSIINLTVRNTGTSTATLSNVGITTTGAFSVAPAPALPTTIAPGGSLNVSVRFEPVTVGFTSATLAIDGTSIPVNGSGTQPPALPAYTIAAPAGTAPPLSQPLTGLKLAAPYPVTLNGTLTLSTSSGSLPPDPAVQFATGGRTVNFRIPANTTDAIFGTTSSPIGTQIGLQTGTVAETITLIPSFATQAGNIDLTPQQPAIAQFSVAAAAPSAINLEILNSTATSFSVAVTGFSTTRSLTSMKVTFKTASNFSMDPSEFTINLAPAATGWFQSSASQAFGGQFRVTVPFSFELPANRSILNGITAVSATVSNATGTSQTIEVPVR